jgi:hypothetical protein
MAIVKASYTKKGGGAKASIKYIEHRPGKDGAKINRVLFGVDGAMGRYEANRMIDEAEEGSTFFRFIISPDPNKEDSNKDLHLRDITEKTMHELEERIQTNVAWVAAEHNDHAPHRHVHVVAVLPGKLYRDDLRALTYAATEASLEQRQERDLALELKKREAQEREAQWERSY